MGGQQTSNTLAALLVARVPAWVQVGQVGYLTDPPIGTAEALDLLAGSPRTHVWHQNKRRQDRRSGFVYLVTLDIGATYTLTINGVGHVYDASAGGAANAADVLDGLAAQIVVDAPAFWSATAVKAGDGSSATVALMIESSPSGDAGAPSTFVATSAGATGSGVMHVFAEATSFDYQVWQTAVSGRSDGRPDEGHWFKVLDTASTASPETAILNTSAGERVAVVVDAFVAGEVTDGLVGAFVFPGFYIYVGLATDEVVTGDA